MLLNSIYKPQPHFHHATLHGSLPAHPMKHKKRECNYVPKTSMFVPMTPKQLVHHDCPLLTKITFFEKSYFQLVINFTQINNY